MERGNEALAAAASALQWWDDAGVDIIDRRDAARLAAPEAQRSARHRRQRPTAPAASLLRPPRPTRRCPASSISSRPGFATATASPSPRRPRRASAPSGDPASGLMIVADMPTGEDCAAGTLIAGEAGRTVRPDARRDRPRPRLHLSRRPVLPALADRQLHHATRRSNARRSRATISASSRRRRCCCSATRPPRPCSASRSRRRAGAGTKSPRITARSRLW